MERETPGQRPRPNYGHPHVDGVEPADAVQPDGIELAEAVQPDEAAPTHEERASDPQELPQAVTLKPNLGGGSATTIHKRARPPP